jgi:hypothetical protein
MTNTEKLVIVFIISLSIAHLTYQCVIEWEQDEVIMEKAK